MHCRLVVAGEALRMEKITIIDEWSINSNILLYDSCPAAQVTLQCSTFEFGLARRLDIDYWFLHFKRGEPSEFGSIG